MDEQVIDVIEIRKVGVYLDYPIRLNQDEGREENDACSPSHEWPILHICNKIVKAP
jgi:hypothetical protein